MITSLSVNYTHSIHLLQLWDPQTGYLEWLAVKWIAILEIKIGDNVRMSANGNYIVTCLNRE